MKLNQLKTLIDKWIAMGYGDHDAKFRMDSGKLKDIDYAVVPSDKAPNVVFDEEWM